jgi:hypothetical protein
MATITVYNAELDQNYQIDVTLEDAVVNGSGAGASSFYIKLATNRKDPLGQSIPNRIIEDLGASDVSSLVTAEADSMIEEIKGSLLSSSESSGSSTLRFSTSSSILERLAIPYMTDWNVPSPYEVAESSLIGDIISPAWKAFSPENANDGWRAKWVENMYITVDLGFPVAVDSYYIQSNIVFGDGLGIPRNWIIYGSNSLPTWSMLDQRSWRNVTSGWLQYMTSWQNNTPPAYRYYKLVFTGKEGPSLSLGIQTIRLYASPYSSSSESSVT